MLPLVLPLLAASQAPMVDPNSDYNWVLMALQTTGEASFSKAPKFGSGPAADSATAADYSMMDTLTGIKDGDGWVLKTAWPTVAGKPAEQYEIWSQTSGTAPWWVQEAGRQGRRRVPAVGRRRPVSRHARAVRRRRVHLPCEEERRLRRRQLVVLRGLRCGALRRNSSLAPAARIARLRGHGGAVGEPSETGWAVVGGLLGAAALYFVGRIGYGSTGGRWQGRAP